MLRKSSILTALFTLALIPCSFAQQGVAQQGNAQQHDHGSQNSQQDMDHGQMAAQGEHSCMMMGQGGQGGMMQHDGSGGMMQQGGQGGMMQGRNQSQAANSREGFSAIQDRVRELEADPNTDWSQIDIDALRTHLVDMDRVIMQASVTRSELADGMRYVVAGNAEVAESIKRMVPTHAAQMQTELDWNISTEEQAAGVVLEVTASDANDIAKIRALGFSGFMVLGNHHEAHHQEMSGSSGDHQH